jgi:heparin binding hemagglutinin HbhA
MTFVSDIRKTVTDTTPVYAAVGATDLAVEIVRDARDRAVAARADFNVSTLQDKAVQRAEQVYQIPALALNQTLEAAGLAQSHYVRLAVRGEKLVKRIRNQKSTKDLFAQAGSTVSFGKGAVTTVRKAAVDTGRAAKSTLTTGRLEAEAAVGAVAASVRGEAKTAKRTVRKSGPATRLATKRTATVAKKRTAAVKRATKATVTSASTTATAATEAVKIATPKVGD